MKFVALFLISIYQKLFSTEKGLIRFFGFSKKTCRFSPTCSEYTYQAIERYGILKGIRLGTSRILRCHPWSPGGFDPLS